MTDTLLMIVFPILLSCWLLVSSIIFIWWFFDADMRKYFIEHHTKIAMGVLIAVYCGAFSLFLLILNMGIEKLLVFIPDNWGGYDEHGDFVTTRSYVAFTLAFSLSIFFIYVFYKFEKMRTENRRLAIFADIQKRKDKLRHCSRELLIEERDKAKTTLERLRNLSYKGDLSTKGEAEMQVLNELLPELEYRIRETEKSH